MDRDWRAGGEARGEFAATAVDADVGGATRARRGGPLAMVPAAKRERARMLLAYADGLPIAAIARHLHTYYYKVKRCLDWVPEVGPVAALNDQPRSGRKTKITAEARAWLVTLACQKPTELGYSYEQWTMRLLSEYVRRHAVESGHPSLQQAVPATVWRILSRNKVQPHRPDGSDGHHHHPAQYE